MRRSSFPGVDDHLVEPEVTRDEIIGGRRIVAMPAQPPHATKQTQLDYVIQAHTGRDYHAAADLLTRFAEDSDFASDVCVYKNGVDPATGARYLEEIVFEVVSEQNEKVVTEKAEMMQRRGVRRIFAVFVKGQRVCEWSSDRWHPMDRASRIEDPCFVAPIAVAALLDAAVADNAVVEALAAKSNPALRQREAAAEVRGEAKGEARGKAEAILAVFEARGVAVSEAQRQVIQGCHDGERLDLWLRRAAVASSADEIESAR